MSNRPRGGRGGFFGWLLGGGSEDPDGTVVAGTVPSRAEAELLAGFLRDKGIRAIVSADDEAGLSPNLTVLRGVRILVRRSDASRARTLIDGTDTG